ncbi:hypothetical protein AJ80_00245 [Polytolypa hystricis UAMH7299]|uniref:Diphthine--ammonia ligase n=1 Tax=Polytolypa hystricis (strain UAMH7299) TaxID=1447883 RepID=A0A2B7Z3K7_POLH7|nr:hypothetical protein AJ80_00245 [Polytolypa hystricis UAMH7299]
MAQQQQLHVIALISGGKDSIYSILHCLKHGHKIIALANLHPPSTTRTAKKIAHSTSSEAQLSPPPSGKTTNYSELSDHQDEVEDEEEDLESYMYQTIGHSIIPLYQSALDIPLYRAPIYGTAVNTARDYQTPHHPEEGQPNAPNIIASSEAGQSEEEEDEIESLIPLLRHIMARHPTANAVSAGAILSTYQRTRIENVAARLDLVSLAWLWMYPYLPPPAERASSPTVAGLLEDMAACGCEARIIKIASGGLDVDVLWGDVAGSNGAVRRQVIKGLSRFGGEGVEGAVLGEGGEYESLALDGPRALWKRRIVVEDVDTRSGEGGAASVRIKGAKCVDKEDAEGAGDGLESVKVPQMFDPEFKTVLGEVLDDKGYDSAEEQQRTSPGEGSQDWSIEAAQVSGNDGWTISNISAPEIGPGAGKQMEGIVRKLEDILHSQKPKTEDGVSTSDIVFTTILLRSMKDFASINKVYASLFKRPNPPARVTVACGNSLPNGVDILLSVVLDLGPHSSRQGLHVQSRSYWAPANIGPYSQAISVPLKQGARLEQDGGLVYIAGQIPLEPSSMDIACFPNLDQRRTWFEDFTLQTVLSLQHLWRIGRVTEVDWWLGAVAFLAGNERIPSKARIAYDIWKRMNTAPTVSDEEEDKAPALDAWDIKYGRQYELQTTPSAGRSLPNFEVFDDRDGTLIPPFFAVQVDELPRDSAIEWQGLGVRSSSLRMQEENEMIDGMWSSCSTGAAFGASCYVGLKEEGSDHDLERRVRKAVEVAKQKAMDQMGAGEYQCHAVIYTRKPLAHRTGNLGQIVPCVSVWSLGARRLAAGVIVHCRPV